MSGDNELKVGTKYGAGKPQPSLVPYDAIAWLARVLEYGAAKYARGNWQKLDSEANRIKLLDALERHVGEFKSGKAFDVESKMPVIAHVLCNAVFLTYFLVRDGIPGSDPHELTDEQRQALAEAKTLGLMLAHEAKMKECDKLDASPIALAALMGFGKAERAAAALERQADDEDVRRRVSRRDELERAVVRLSLGSVSQLEARQISDYSLELISSSLSKDSK